MSKESRVRENKERRLRKHLRNHPHDISAGQALSADDYRSVFFNRTIGYSKGYKRHAKRSEARRLG